MDNATEVRDIDENISQFNYCLYDVCTQNLKTKIKPQNTYWSSNEIPKKPWYDDECKTKQTEFYENLNFYRNNKNNENRKNMAESRSDYKTLVRSKKNTIMINIKQIN